MYTVEFLPIAKKDIDDIIYYISYTLKNSTAAKNISNRIIKGIDIITEFPYGFSYYNPTKKLKYKYRSIKIGNFLMFYTINEKTKVITIIRVLHQKMDFQSILK